MHARTHACIHASFMSIAKRPVPVTSDVELGAMKNKIAELKAQLNKVSLRERFALRSDRGIHLCVILFSSLVKIV